MKKSRLLGSPLETATLIGLVTIIWSWSKATSFSSPFVSDPMKTVSSTIAGLGVLVIFIERTTEVVINAVRTEGKTLADRLASLDPNSQEHAQTAQILRQYKADTEKLSLLAGLTLGVLTSCTGVGVLTQILDLTIAIPQYLELRRSIDIILTAGLLAGGSQAFHGNVSNKIRDTMGQSPQ